MAEVMKSKQILLLSVVGLLTISLSGCSGWSKNRYYEKHTDTMRVHSSPKDPLAEKEQTARELQKQLSALKIERIQLDQKIADLQYQLRHSVECFFTDILLVAPLIPP